jgi:hypothetical protein
MHGLIFSGLFFCLTQFFSPAHAQELARPGEFNLPTTGRAASGRDPVSVPASTNYQACKPFIGQPAVPVTNLGAQDYDSIGLKVQKLAAERATRSANFYEDLQDCVADRSPRHGTLGGASCDTVRDDLIKDIRTTDRCYRKKNLSPGSLKFSQVPGRPWLTSFRFPLSSPGAPESKSGAPVSASQKDIKAQLSVYLDQLKGAKDIESKKGNEVSELVARYPGLFDEAAKSGSPGHLKLLCQVASRAEVIQKGNEKFISVLKGLGIVALGATCFFVPPAAPLCPMLAPKISYGFVAAEIKDSYDAINKSSAEVGVGLRSGEAHELETKQRVASAAVSLAVPGGFIKAAPTIKGQLVSAGLINKSRAGLPPILSGSTNAGRAAVGSKLKGDKDERLICND